jgi:hypothetical protein
MEEVNKLANHDVRNDTTPLNTFTKPKKPQVSDLRTALLTVNGGASYPAAVLNTMTYNDMVYASRVHSLSVVGL